MKKQTTLSKNPDIIASAKALRRAARRALEIGMRTGTPVYVMKNGRIMDLTQKKTKRDGD
jgi:Fe2+ transport system protein FeoA